MRKRALIPIILGAFVLIVVGSLLSQQNAEDAKFAKLIDTYLDEYWKFYPTAGSLAGYSKYDNKLEDFSESNLDKRGNALDAINKELVTKIAFDKLSSEVLIDREILLDAIDFELFRLESLVPQEYNPLTYNEIFLHSIRSLLVNLTDAKLTAATDRAKALPGLVKFAKDNLKTPPKEYTEAAIKQIPAILAFYKNEAPALVEKGGPAVKAKYLPEHAKVVAALEDWAQFLQNGLLAKSTGNFRLGPEAHTKMIRLTSQGSLQIQDLIARSQADSTNIRRAMTLICIPYYKILFPETDIEKVNYGSEDATMNQVIKSVLDKIKGPAFAKDQWIEKVKASAADIKAFVEKNGLFDLPPDALAIDPMAPCLQPMMKGLALAGPAPYATGGSWTLGVQPLPADWPADKAASFLDEFNAFYLPFWTIERVYPGPFVPSAFVAKNANLLRKLYPSQPLTAGWPLYTIDMFVPAGFGDYDLRLRFFQLKSQLKALLEFQMELNVHQSTTTKEQLVSYLTRSGFISEAEAELTWEKIVLNPGSCIYPYMGYQEILDMEKDVKAKNGSFNRKDFLNKLVSFGPLPIRTLKTRIVQ